MIDFKQHKDMLEKLMDRYALQANAYGVSDYETDKWHILKISEHCVDIKIDALVNQGYPETTLSVARAITNPIAYPVDIILHEIDDGVTLLTEPTVMDPISAKDDAGKIRHSLNFAVQWIIHNAM